MFHKFNESKRIFNRRINASFQFNVRNLDKKRNFVKIFQKGRKKMFQLLFILILNVAGFSKSEYFKVIAGSDVNGMTKMMDKLEKATENTDQMAYLGALKMKKAEHLKTPKDKLELFKAGKELLEKAISKNGSNAEYRFLRLMIQENAPKVLKYNTKVQEDAKFISSNYLSLSSDVKSAVLNYSKTSASLKI